MPLQAFLYAERASEFPQPYVKFSVEPARRRRRAGGDRARLLRRDAAALRTDLRLGAGRRLDPSDAAGRGPRRQPRARARSGRDEGAGGRAVGEQAPCPRRRPRRRSRRGRRSDGAGGGESQGRGLGQPVFGALFVSRNGIRNSQVSCMPRPGQLSDALREHDLVVVIGAPVFTFHVEGHASIFDGATSIFQITDDPTAAAITPAGTSIIATMKPALAMLLELLPETQTRDRRRAARCRRRRRAADPIPVEFLLHALSHAMPDDAVLVEEAPSHRPAMQKFMPMRGQDSFYTMASGGLGYSLPAAVGMALGRPGIAHRLPDRRRLGDVFDPGAVDRRAAQAAADGRRDQQCRLRRDALVQPGDAGAQCAGPRTARHRFRQARRRHGLPRRARDKIIRARARAQARAWRMTASA